MKCNMCNIETTKRGLSYHLSYTHKISYKQYYDMFLKCYMDGICKTCGKETKFHNAKYQQFCCKTCRAKNVELNKIKQVKSKQTCLEKYGTEYNSQSIEHRKKVKKWWSNPHNIYKIQLISQNRRNTNIEKYGVDNPAKNEKIKKMQSEIAIKNQNEFGTVILNKRKSTCLKKYGVDNVRKSECVINKIKNTKLNKYGKLCLSKNLPVSKMSQAFFKQVVLLNSDILLNYQFHDFNKEFSLQMSSGNKFYYDFVDHGIKKIIEFNGMMFHPVDTLIDDETNWNLYKKNLTAKEAREKEKIKYELAEFYGYSIIKVWDFEVKADLASSLKRVSDFLRNI